MENPSLSPYDPAWEGLFPLGPSFTFLSFGCLSDGIVEVEAERKIRGYPSLGMLPSIECSMLEAQTRRTAGHLRLTLGYNESLFYYGHIGYSVYPFYRGNAFALRACKLIRPVALAYRHKHLLITCNPDNYPSKRTCENLGAHLLGEVEVPAWHDLFLQGETRKLVYLWEV